MPHHDTHPNPAPDRNKLLENLAGLYSLREDMRRADKPVIVHVLTAAIKMRTHQLKELGYPPGTVG